MFTQPTWQSWPRELYHFTRKEAQACVFAGLFFLSVWIVPRTGVWGIARYDALLLIALVIQLGMLLSGMETWDELKAICAFHVLGFVLEVFKTSSGIKSWSYPDPAFTKLWGVPLFSGFMYAAVGSYIIQAWRLLRMRVEHHPPYWMAGLVAKRDLSQLFYAPLHRRLPLVPWGSGAGALCPFSHRLSPKPDRPSHAFGSRSGFGCVFHLAGGKHRHLPGFVGLPPSNGCMGHGTREQMGCMVIVGAHELHHRHHPQTHQNYHSCVCIKPPRARHPIAADGRLAH